MSSHSNRSSNKSKTNRPPKQSGRQNNNKNDRRTGLHFSPNLRADAAWVLYQVLEHGVSTSELMPKVWERHAKPQDRAWLQELIYGVLRNLPIMQLWLRELLDKPLKNQQKIIELLILTGLYQLHFMRTADHAAISETVEACKTMNEFGLSKVVNAVLRRFLREELGTKISASGHAEFGLPKWLYKALLNNYPDNADAIAKSLQERAKLWLRINTLKTTVDDYKQTLESAGFDCKHIGGSAISVEKAGEVALLPHFEDGHFAVQDLAAQQSARLLNPQASDIVLDCCAAPGGKTAALLEFESELSALYAIDSVASRLSRVHENLERLGHSSRFAKHLKIIEQDATKLTANADLPLFDKILLDAPCSATGVIRRHPDIMWLRKMTDIDVLVDLQHTILKEAWAKLKKGGVLLYATCSILPKENQEQIERFLAENNDAKLDTITKLDGQETQYWQILPGQSNMDGFFYARLLKC